jgi:CxxC motif-containing protein
MDVNKTITCISCPKGCRIEVQIVDGILKEIKNYQCKRGFSYAQTEVMDPKRVLTTTVKVEGGGMRVLPVRTKGPIPKKMLRKAMWQLKDVIIKPPVKTGDVVLKNVADSGVDVIATGNCG